MSVLFSCKMRYAVKFDDFRGVITRPLCCVCRDFCYEGEEYGPYERTKLVVVGGHEYLIHERCENGQPQG